MKLYAIDKTTGCWIGINKPASCGHVQIRVGKWHGGQRLKVLLHKYMYEKYYGPVPKGYELHHICGNKACCNIFHLKPLKHKEHFRKHNYMHFVRSNGYARYI